MPDLWRFWCCWCVTLYKNQGKEIDAYVRKKYHADSTAQHSTVAERLFAYALKII